MTADNDNVPTLKLILEFDHEKFGVSTPWGWEIWFNGRLCSSGKASDYANATKRFSTWKGEHDAAIKPSRGLN